MVDKHRSLKAFLDFMNAFKANSNRPVLDLSLYLKNGDRVKLIIKVVREEERLRLVKND